MANTFTPQKIINALLTGAAASYYQVAALTTLNITQMSVTNGDLTNAHTVIIYLCPNSSTPTFPGPYVIARVILAPGQTQIIGAAIGADVNAQGTIQAQADQDSVVAFSASGNLIT